MTKEVYNDKLNGINDSTKNIKKTVMKPSSEFLNESVMENLYDKSDIEKLLGFVKDKGIEYLQAAKNGVKNSASKHGNEEFSFFSWIMLIHGFGKHGDWGNVRMSKNTHSKLIKIIEDYIQSVIIIVEQLDIDTCNRKLLKKDSNRKWRIENIFGTKLTRSFEKINNKLWEDCQVLFDDNREELETHRELMAGSNWMSRNNGHKGDPEPWGNSLSCIFRDMANLFMTGTPSEFEMSNGTVIMYINRYASNYEDRLFRETFITLYNKPM